MPHEQPQKIIFLYFENHWTDRAQVLYTHNDSPAKEFEIVKSDVHRHVRKRNVLTPPQIPLLCIDYHWVDHALIWYVHRDPSAKWFALVKSEMCAHVPRAQPLKIPLLHLNNHLADRAVTW